MAGAEGDQFDVVIVGLGPAGAIAANVLGQYGHSVLVVEQNDGAGLRPRAGGADEETQRLLQSVGLVDEFLGMSGNMVMGLDDCRVKWENANRNGRGYNYRGFYQPKFEELLREGMKRFTTVKTLLSTRCLSVSQTADQVVVEVQSDRGTWEKTAGDEAVFVSKPEGPTQHMRCKFVLGCDGSKSVVRKAMAATFIDLGFTERWWAVDLKLLDETRVWGTKITKSQKPRSTIDLDRASGIIPLWQITDRGPRGRHVRFEFKVEPGDEKTYGGDLQSWDRLRTLVSNWLDPEDYELVRWAMYHFRGLIADRWRNGRMFLVGDACHTMPPYMGQGLNQGFKDVANLSWKLSAVLRGVVKTDDLLDTYQEEREPIATMVTQASMMVGQNLQKMRAAIAARKAAKKASGDPGKQANVDNKGSTPTKKNLVSEMYEPQKLAELMSSNVRQRTDGVKPYPPLIDGKEDGLTGKSFPQVSVQVCGSPAVRRLDDVVGPPGFLLIAVSQDGTAIALSAASAAFLTQVGGSIMQLALSAPAGNERLADGCEFHISIDEPWKDLEQLAPVVALVRPDRCVLGAARPEHGDALVQELRRYLSGDPTHSRI